MCFSPLSEEELLRARKLGLMAIRLGYVVKDIGTYIIYLVFLFIIAQSNRDQDRYHFSNAVGNSVNLSRFKLVSRYFEKSEYFDNTVF